MIACPHDPRENAGKPIGMYHCPICGDMVVAGISHPERDGVDIGHADSVARDPRTDVAAAFVIGRLIDEVEFFWRASARMTVTYLGTNEPREWVPLAMANGIAQRVHNKRTGSIDPGNLYRLRRAPLCWVLYVVGRYLVTSCNRGQE